MEVFVLLLLLLLIYLQIDVRHLNAWSFRYMFKLKTASEFNRMVFFLLLYYFKSIFNWQFMCFAHSSKWIATGCWQMGERECVCVGKMLVSICCTISVFSNCGIDTALNSPIWMNKIDIQSWISFFFLHSPFSVFNNVPRVKFTRTFAQWLILFITTCLRLLQNPFKFETTKLSQNEYTIEIVNF